MDTSSGAPQVYPSTPGLYHLTTQAGEHTVYYTLRIPAGYDGHTALPHCVPRCVPGSRPYGSIREITSDQPFRCAAHDTWLSESRQAMIAIVPSPCRDGGNAVWATVWGGGVHR
jgi:hypothetical protein